MLYSERQIYYTEIKTSEDKTIRFEVSDLRTYLGGSFEKLLHNGSKHALQTIQSICKKSFRRKTFKIEVFFEDVGENLQNVVVDDDKFSSRFRNGCMRRIYPKNIRKARMTDSKNKRNVRAIKKTAEKIRIINRNESTTDDEIDFNKITTFGPEASSSNVYPDYDIPRPLQLKNSFVDNVCMSKTTKKSNKIFSSPDKYLHYEKPKTLKTFSGLNTIEEVDFTLSDSENEGTPVAVLDPRSKVKFLSVNQKNVPDYDVPKSLVKKVQNKKFSLSEEKKNGSIKKISLIPAKKVNYSSFGPGKTAEVDDSCGEPETKDQKEDEKHEVVPLAFKNALVERRYHLKPKTNKKVRFSTFVPDKSTKSESSNDKLESTKEIEEQNNSNFRSVNQNLVEKVYQEQKPDITQKKVNQAFEVANSVDIKSPYENKFAFKTKAYKKVSFVPLGSSQNNKLEHSNSKPQENDEKLPTEQNYPDTDKKNRSLSDLIMNGELDEVQSMLENLGIKEKVSEESSKTQDTDSYGLNDSAEILIRPRTSRVYQKDKKVLFKVNV